MQQLERAKHHLLSGSNTCVLCKGEKLHTSTLRGVKPLVIWLESGDDFAGYAAADKVIGKATAFLYVLLGIKAVYAGVISRSAQQVLSDYGIATQYGILVENIINRQGTGICPFEAAVLDIEDAQIAYRVIRAKMAQMNISLH